MAKQRLDDWNSYLDEFAANRSLTEYLIEVAKGFISHVCFRIATDTTSTVPLCLGLIVGSVSATLLTFVTYPPVSYSTAADVHVAVALTCLVVAFLRRPSKIEFSWPRAASTFFVGTGYLHVAIGMEPAFGAPLTFTSTTLLGFGFAITAASAVRTRSMLGHSLVGALLVGLGGAINVSANLLEVGVQHGGVLPIFASASAVIAVGWVTVAGERLWTSGRRAAMAAHQAQKIRPNQGLLKQP